MTRFAGIIGHPIGHSMSPAFQQAAFDALGLDVRYERWGTPPGQLPQRMAALRREDHLGANVTVPHKLAAADFLDDVDPLARSIGAVNTVVNSGGRLTGHNTDAHGLVTALEQEIGKGLAGMSVLVLGAGGAARAAVFGLARKRVGRVVIANRTASKAVALAAQAAPLVPALGMGNGGPEIERAAAGADLIVNCTSAGMAGGGAEGDIPLPPHLIHTGAVVFDMVYNPRDTPLLAAAADAGAVAIGGLAMLVHQGAASFELWTGRPAPLDAMLRAARNAMAERENMAPG